METERCQHYRFDDGADLYCHLGDSANERIENTTPTRKSSETACQAIRRSGTRMIILTLVVSWASFFADKHEKLVGLVFSIFLIELMNSGSFSNSKQRR